MVMQAYQDMAKMLKVLQKMHTEAWQAKYLMTLTGMISGSVGKNPKRIVMWHISTASVWQCCANEFGFPHQCNHACAGAAKGVVLSRFTQHVGYILHR